MTKDDALLRSSNCPHCNAVFTFDQQIQQSYRFYLTEKQEHEEALRQQYAARAAAQRDQERAHQRQIDERQRLLQESRDNRIRDVSVASGMVMTVAILGWIGTALAFIASLSCYNSPELRGLSQSWLTIGITGLMTVNIFFAFFRILEAIHGVLVKILDQLRATSADR